MIPRLTMKRYCCLLLVAAACRPTATGVVRPDGDPCHIPGDILASLDTVTIGFSPLEQDAERFRLRLSGDSLAWSDCQAQARLEVAGRPRADAPVLHVQVHGPGTDERDLLDLPRGGLRRAVDLLITRDPEAIDYARNKPGFRAVALPWDRTYVVVAPVTRPALPSGDEGRLGVYLSRDVVRAESRPAQTPFWWESAPCPGTMPLRPMGRLPQVAYQEGDATARDLAERLVALQTGSLRAVAYPPDAFNVSLAGGEAAMYVLALSSAPGECASHPQWPASSSVVPLVETRAHALIRAGVPSFTIESDGALRFDSLLSAASPGR